LTVNFQFLELAAGAIVADGNVDSILGRLGVVVVAVIADGGADFDMCEEIQRRIA